MRKSFTILIALLLNILGTQAAPVSESSAAEIAGNFFSNGNNIQSITELRLSYVSHLDNEKSKNTIQSDNRVLYYVYNIGTNFVIIAGDDASSPILAYSQESSFDPQTIPLNTRNWLKYYEEQLKYIIENNLYQTPEIKKEWEDIRKSKKNVNVIQKSIAPLMETKWNQSPFYNDLCPYDSIAKRNAVTGCVATAMAQVMRYWKYPPTGSGIHSYTHQKFGKLTANFGAATYLWDSMPNSVQQPNFEVAQIMYHCGVSVDMNYSVGGSGASPARLSPAFINYFGYDTTVKLLDKNQFKEDEWITIVKSELDSQRPICYTGYGSGGHEFVCDGYNEDGLFHINWGWGGYLDGYFKISELNPGTSNFSSFQAALVGLKPPSEKIDPKLEIYEIIVANPKKFFLGSSFSISANIFNNSDIPFRGDLCATIFDSKNTFVDYVEILNNCDTLFPLQSYSENLSFRYEGKMKLVPGKYKIYINWRKREGEWKLVRRNSADSSILEYTEIEVFNENPIKLFTTITTKPKRIVGQGNNLYVKYKVVNLNPNTFYGYLGVAFYDLEGNMLKVLDREEIVDGLIPNDFDNGIFEFNAENIDLPPGEYYLTGIYKKYADLDYSIIGSQYYFVNPLQFTIIERPKTQDNYEPNNDEIAAYELIPEFSNDRAVIDINAANIHQGTDLDYFKIEFPSEYDYLLEISVDDIYNSNGEYTLDAMIYYSFDGENWSEDFDNYVNPPLGVYGRNTVYFKIIASDDGNVGTYNFKIDIKRRTWAPIISLSDNIAFEKVEVGKSISKTFIVKNIGKHQMKVDSIIVPKGYQVDFQSGSLDSGQVQTVNLTFAPDAPKIFAGKVIVHSNAEMGTNYFQVYGTGYSTNIAPIIALSGDLNFGKVAIGSSASLILTIENKGNATLDVYSITYPECYYDEWFNGSIMANSKEEIEVFFEPSKVKQYNGQITVNCNAEEGTKTIDIKGEGFDPNSVSEGKTIMEVFPNPASDYIIVGANGHSPLRKGGVSEEIRIFDVFGNCVFTVGVQNFEPLQRVDVSTLPPGLYFVLIGDEVRKFMVVR